MTPATSDAIGGRLAEHARMLWGVCYRMTGSAADADDLVQETFVRAMERPPASLAEPIAPWLLRVAVNLGRDALRRRKRRSYVGPWLPSPIEADEVASFEIGGEPGTEGRYDLIESVSFAFLLALEVLTPSQRAVLILRDVLDRSVRETAETLGMSEANVKVVHHRARKALEPYEASRATTRPSPEVAKSTAEALQRFIVALGSGDESTVANLFAEGVESLSDGGGVFLASRVVVRGPSRVAKMFLGLTRKGSAVERFAVRMINGTPMFVAERTPRAATEAPRFVMGFEVDAAGKITRVYTVLAPEKMTRVPKV
ncbi:MAG: sigma-70 family RNA polymerase sigma factor [Polyangiaceae bacterium]